MDGIEISRISGSQVDVLQQIAWETFHESFFHNNPASDMKLYMDQAFDRKRLLEELQHPDSEFYFARDGDQVIGYLKINFGPAQTDIRDDCALEIERIYVRKTYHGKKVGQLLCDFALEIARGKGLDFVWLGVWEHNPRAIRFYEKNGFVAFGQHEFLLGTDEQIDILMRLELGD